MCATLLRKGCYCRHSTDNVENFFRATILWKGCKTPLIEHFFNFSKILNLNLSTSASAFSRFWRLSHLNYDCYNKDVELWQDFSHLLIKLRVPSKYENCRKLCLVPTNKSRKITRNFTVSFHYKRTIVNEYNLQKTTYKTHKIWSFLLPAVPFLAVFQQ